MKDSTMGKAGFWFGVVGTVTGIVGCVFGPLTFFGIGPDAVREAFGGLVYAVYPFAMIAFGFVFGFSVRYLFERNRAREMEQALADAVVKIEELKQEVSNLEKEVARKDALNMELHARMANGELTTVEQVEDALAAVLEKDRNDPSHLWRRSGTPNWRFEQRDNGNLSLRWVDLE